jgi:hypothetical protein
MINIISLTLSNKSSVSCLILSKPQFTFIFSVSSPHNAWLDHLLSNNLIFVLITTDSFDFYFRVIFLLLLQRKARIHCWDRTVITVLFFDCCRRCLNYLMTNHPKAIILRRSVVSLFGLYLAWNWSTNYRPSATKTLRNIAVLSSLESFVAGNSDSTLSMDRMVECVSGRTT